VGRSRAGSQSRLATVARTQHRLFTLAQALACGCTADFVWRQARDGRWLEVEPHVYRVTLAGVRTWQERLLAVVLTTGGAAADRSAAALFGLVRPPAVPEIVVDRREWSTRHRRPEVRAVRDLEACDRVTVDGIPTTSVSRTLLELARRVPEREAVDLVDEGGRVFRITSTALRRSSTNALAPVVRAVSVRSPGRAGGPLRRRGGGGRGR